MTKNMGKYINSWKSSELPLSGNEEKNRQNKATKQARGSERLHKLPRKKVEESNFGGSPFKSSSLSKLKHGFNSSKIKIVREKSSKNTSSKSAKKTSFLEEYFSDTLTVVNDINDDTRPGRSEMFVSESVVLSGRSLLKT